MEKLSIESKIVLNKKTFKIREVVKYLYSMSTDDVVAFFKAISLNMPRRLRMDAIKDVLRDKVKQTRKERDSLADELNYRLKWFKEYSDTQLINLLSYYNLTETNDLFMQTFWLSVLNYLLERGLSEKHLNDLLSKAEKNAKKNGIGYSDVKVYNEALGEIFYDEPNHLDGLPPKKIRPVLYKSSTLVEIREIGKKYGVNVPRRLKKQQLLQIIFDELEERKQLDNDLKESLSKKSVIAIQRYAKDNEIKVSTELTKEEIIEYILENAHQTKEAYFKPETSDYHFEVEDPLEEEEKETPIEDAEEIPLEIEEEVITNNEMDEESISVESENTESESRVVTKVPSYDDALQNAPKNLVINAARYVGSKVAFEDDYLGFDGAKALITEKERKQKVPAEIRFIWKFIIAVFVLVLRIVSFFAIIALSLILILFVYGSVMHFTDISSLDVINDFINEVSISGKGLLDHISAFYNSIGLKS